MREEGEKGIIYFQTHFFIYLNLENANRLGQSGENCVFSC